MRVVTSDRPDRANAIDLETGEALAAAFDEMERDDATRAVVLTGAGERVFWLVNRVAPDPEVVDAAIELAARMAAYDPRAVEAAKRVAFATVAGGEEAGWEVNG